jgi:hypothetical protein
VGAESVERWLEIIFRLEGDEAFQEESRRATEAGKICRPEVLGPRYVEYRKHLLG